MSELIRVENLCRYYKVNAGLVARRQLLIKAVDGVSFHIDRGETLGLVGETGCGKSTIGRMLVGLETPSSGKIVLPTPAASGCSKPATRQMIFQDPYASLDPRFTAADIIAEPWAVRGLFQNPGDRQSRAADLLTMVGLNPDHASRYPHEFSGGQRQRLGIARALAAEPDLIVCDEPLSSLDVSVQAQIVNLLQELQASMGLTYLFIAHDLAMIRHLCRRILVMYLGALVETGLTDNLFAAPLHPYTRALLAAVPIPDPSIERTRTRVALHGDIPSPLNPPTGCRFHPRCPQAMPICRQCAPTFVAIEGDHHVSCHLYGHYESPNPR